MSTRDQVLASIQEFCRQHNMSEAAFGFAVVKDRKFVPRLRGGLGITLTSIEKAEQFMRERQPPAEQAAA